MKKAFIIAGVSALALLISAVSAPPLWALSVAPARTEVRLSPGGTTEAILTVTNTHDETYDVELSEKPWFIYPDNKTIQVEDWLHLPKTQKFRLKRGESREVKIKIVCPKNATGELMGMVSFTYLGLTPSMITPMISTAVYLDVAGTERADGKIVALGAGTKDGRFQVGTQVQATGNVRLRPSGTVRLLDSKGQEISVYNVAEASPIFPGTIRDYAASGPDKAPPAGRYTLSADLHSGTLDLKADRVIKVKANGDVEMDDKIEAPPS